MARQKVILVTGLAGTGKTTYAESLGPPVLEYGVVHDYRIGVTDPAKIHAWLNKHPQEPTLVMDSWGFNLDPHLYSLQAILGEDKELEIHCLYTTPEQLADVQRKRHIKRGLKHPKSQMTIPNLRQVLAEEMLDFATRFIQPAAEESGAPVKWLYRNESDVTEHGLRHLRLTVQSIGRVHFLLLSDRRTGTQMLWKAMQSHPAVLRHRLFGKLPDSVASPEELHREWEEFRNQELPPGVTHLGVMQHRQGPDWIRSRTFCSSEGYWDMLHNRHQKVICLTRRNLLRQFLSGKIECLTNNRHDVAQPRLGGVMPIQVTLNELDEFIEATDQIRRQTDAAFPLRLSIAYEELVTDWRETTDKIQVYLGLDRIDLPLTTYRQEVRPLRQIIENYNEVETHLNHQGRGDWNEA